MKGWEAKERDPGEMLPLRGPFFWLCSLSKCGTISLLPFFYSGSREEVSAMSRIADFLLAVGASVVGYYVSKWLDSWRKGR